MKNKMEIEDWGEFEGQKIKRISLENAGLKLAVLSFGATMQSLEFLGKDRLLGYDDLEGYVKGKSFQGALAGRYANRIAGGKFTLNGVEYSLGCNENGWGHLHGGFEGFNRKVWDYEPIENEADFVGVRFSLLSPDGDEGYPGNLKISVSYRLLKNNTLSISYEASSDKDTVINPTSHGYYNLNDSLDLNILDTKVWINAGFFTPVDEKLIPTGEIRPVKGTAFDFNVEKSIGRDIGAEDNQLSLGSGYDHNFVLGMDRKIRHAAYAYSPHSGVRMDVYTDMPGMQFYTANTLDEPVGKGGKPLGKNQGFCFETQFFPDSPNHIEFPSPILKAREVFKSETKYKFSKI